MRMVGVEAGGNWVDFNYCTCCLAQVAGLLREIYRLALVPLSSLRKSDLGAADLIDAPPVRFVRPPVSSSSAQLSFNYYNAAAEMEGTPSALMSFYGRRRTIWIERTKAF